MTALRRGPAAAWLLGAVTIAGILAVIAGIFGMHVMTGHHSMHLQSAGPAAPVAQSAAAVHHGHADAAEVSAHSTPAHAGPGMPDALSPGPASCGCSVACPGVETTSAPCVPSAKTGTLAAPQPAQGAGAFTNAAALHVGYKVFLGHVPATPSPGELSISRT